MNLIKLFEMQRKLDEKIVEEKGLKGQDLLPKKILALQVELGELCQEWRGFKFWSNDQEPRNKDIICHACGGNGGFDNGETITMDGVVTGFYEPCLYCETTGKQIKNPLLEEYVDCLHFILSIGLELGYTFSPTTKWQSRTTTVQFNDLFHAVATFNESIENDWDEDEKQENFDSLIGGFLGLGEMLGFTWEQIEQAYLEKNKVNHERQTNGY